MSNDYLEPNNSSSTYPPVFTEQIPFYNKQSHSYGQNLPFGQQSYSGQQYPYAAPEVINPYAMNPYGVPEHPNAGLILGLSIAGFFVSIFSFVAWFMGAQARREIETQHNYYWGGNLKTGYYIGKIMSIIQIISAILFVFLFLFGVLAAPFTTNNIMGH